MTTVYGIPLFFEDKTGKISGTDFTDIYDRSPFLRLTQVSQSERFLRLIHELGGSTSSRGGYSEPAVTMEFGTDYSLGNIYFGRSSSRAMPMDRYLRRLSSSGSSLVRIFRASDGADYVWGYRVNRDHEWTCTNMETMKLISHYDLKPEGEPPYRSSGNVLTVYEEYQHLSIELLASLTIMRHIAENRL